MIRVDANLIPHGDPSLGIHSLGFVEIVNDGTGTLTRRNYDVILYSRGDKPRVVKRTRVENWPAKSKSAFRLIIEAIKTLE